jgi:hypothetical protein
LRTGFDYFFIKDDCIKRSGISGFKHMCNYRISCLNTRLNSSTILNIINSRPLLIAHFKSNTKIYKSKQQQKE